MRMVYVDAVQAHPVPSRAYEARGPFARYQPREILDTPFDPDKFPVAGATAQNEMRGVPMYECQDCKAILMETELDGHVCEGDF
jgi:hypothetical protein